MGRKQIIYRLFDVLRFSASPILLETKPRSLYIPFDCFQNFCGNIIKVIHHEEHGGYEENSIASLTSCPLW